MSDETMRRIMIVGPGITAADLAALAVQANLPDHIELVTMEMAEKDLSARIGVAMGERIVDIALRKIADEPDINPFHLRRERVKDWEQRNRKGKNR